jgi:hypothetical protein
MPKFCPNVLTLYLTVFMQTTKNQLVLLVQFCKLLILPHIIVCSIDFLNNAVLFNRNNVAFVLTFGIRLLLQQHARDFEKV